MGDWTALIAIAASQFLSCFGVTAAGVGGGAILHVCWAFASLGSLVEGDLAETLVHLYIGDSLTMLLLSVRLRKFTNWGFCIFVSVLWAGSQMVGTETLIQFNGVWMKRIIGVGLLGIFLFQSTQTFYFVVKATSKDEDKKQSKLPQASKGCECSAIEPPPELDQEGQQGFPANCARECESAKEDASTQSHLPSYAEPASPKEESQTNLSFRPWSKRNLMAAAGLGVVGGFLRGAVGLPLPVLLAFTLYTKIPKDEWRANFSTLTVLSSPMAWYFFFVHKGQYEPSEWPSYLTSVCAVLFAVPLGDWASSRINQQSFRHILMFVMFFGALLLATSGTGFVSTAVIGAAAFMVGSGSLVWKNIHCGRKHVQSSPPDV